MEAYTDTLDRLPSFAWKLGEDRDRHEVVSPATGGAIGALPLATPADLDEALDRSRRAFPLLRATDVEARDAILRRAAALLRERADGVARTLTQERQAARRVDRRGDEQRPDVPRPLQSGTLRRRQPLQSACHRALNARVDRIGKVARQHRFHTRRQLLGRRANLS